MAPAKINVKERVLNDEIDLSLSEIHDVPVKEIAQLKKATSLDLSNNQIKVLPRNFSILTHVTKLDLSRNRIIELPENFGDLTKLRHLDLYQNQLQHLPLSFSKLKALRFLDLKDNPLVPAVAKVSGPCLDTKECQTCAKNIVNFFIQLQEKVTQEKEMRETQRKKQQEINHQREKKEKKDKKKNKQKEIETNGFVKEVPKPSKKEKKNVKKSTTVNKIEEKKCVKCSCIRSLLSLIFFSIIILFVLTSVKYKHTQFIETKVVNLYEKSVAILPVDYKVYGLNIGTYISHVHQKTGILTLNVIDYISNNENIVRFYKNFVIILNNFLNKCKELYNKVVS